jgi:hypothetical protein
MSFTLIDENRRCEVDAVVEGGHVTLAAPDLERATGWALKSEGLCQGGICVPVAPSSGLVRDGRVDLAAFASLLGRPLAMDVDARAAALGDSAHDRSTAMRTGMAPDFTLPDLSGRMHSLGDWRGRKALLIAWASW